MNVSVRWLNRYLDPADLGAEEAERVLTGAGFPIESATGLAEGDTRLDVEVTSNRGDCLCHLGLAREIAAATGRKLKVPPGVGDAETASRASGLGPVEEAVTLENRVPALCPTFRVRVIRGVRVGPSPGWLAGALEAAGHRPISNVVDVTNFVAL
ncbi:MAG TPA: phenylalanine--tRNA ligase beta subunit-related protein, partial [Phycisphaerales bacterium]|nr:phenylalanine--tRNA ligase beta subunit-related protein [Phycisphaerales bacterium]